MKSLNEEISKQLRLIGYDRSKTLIEQDGKTVKTDWERVFNPTKDDKFKTDYNVAYAAMEKIAEEIDGGWAPWKWGTDEDQITDAILSLKNQRQYNYLIYLLKQRYPYEFTQNMGLTQFIQSQEFSEGVDPSILDITRKSPIPMGAEYQYQTNDKYLRQIEKHLQIFNKQESFQKVLPKSVTQMVIPPATSQALHILLPGLSLIFSSFPPAAIAIELVDAGLYAAEGDYYSMGLGICFALIPYGAFALMAKRLSNAEKIAMMTKFQKWVDDGGDIKKINNSEDFTDIEKKLITELLNNPTQYSKILAKEATKMGIIKMLDEVNSITTLHKLVWWLVKKGVLATGFTAKYGLPIAGSFFTWDMIAEQLGLCNNMGIKDLTKSEESYLKPIGGLFGFLQPFTDTCDKNKALNFLKSKLSEGDLKKQIVLDNLDLIIKGNLILNKKDYESRYTLQTLAIQIVLKNLGFTKYTKTTYTMKMSDGTTKKVERQKPQKGYQPGLSPEDIERFGPKYDPSGGLGSSLKQSGLPTSGNPLKDKEIRAKQLELNKQPVAKTETVDINFKWGYYDLDTEMSVKEFQIKNGLTPDGIIGKNTANKLLEKIKTFSTINDYGLTGKLTKEKIEKIQNETLKFINSQKNKSLDNEELNKPLTDEEINRFKKDIENNIDEESSKKLNLNNIDLDMVKYQYDIYFSDENQK